MDKGATVTTFNREHLLRFADAWRVHRLPADAGEQFVQFAEHSIVQWNKRWPPVSSESTSLRLKNLEKHLAGLVWELGLLPPGLRMGLWHNFAMKENGYGKPLTFQECDAKNKEAEIFFDQLHQALMQQQQDMTDVKDRTTYRKIELLEQIVVDYISCFNDEPATSPDGPFMEIIGIIGDAIDMPIGKDVVGDVLRARRSS